MSEIVYEDLYTQIRTGALAPGTPLREDVLTRTYGVSRTPVREALQRLAHDGLLERTSSQRIAVRRLTADQVRDVYPVIAVLEGLGARLAAKNITEKEMTEIDGLHQAMIEGAARGDREVIQRSNVQLHSVVLRATGNEVLVQEVNRFRAITERFRSVVLILPQRPNRSIQDHQELIEALRARDGARAEIIMRKHVTSAEELLLSVLEASQYLDGTPKLVDPAQASTTEVSAGSR